MQRLRTNAQSQLLDDKTLYLCGSEAVTCKILKINSWSMTMATPEPGRSGAAAHARAMIDVDYTGSPLIADHALNETGMAEPHPGQHYPDWTRFGGTSHHVLVFWARHGRREACMGGPPMAYPIVQAIGC